MLTTSFPPVLGHLELFYHEVTFFSCKISYFEAYLTVSVFQKFALVFLTGSIKHLPLPNQAEIRFLRHCNVGSLTWQKKKKKKN